VAIYEPPLTFDWRAGLQSQHGLPFNCRDSRLCDSGRRQALDPLPNERLELEFRLRIGDRQPLLWQARASDNRRKKRDNKAVCDQLSMQP
jgi:hypothetical protein